MSRVAFAKPEAPEAEPAMAGMLGYAKWAALGLVGLLFLFFVTRGLRKREREALGEPMWLREVDAPQSLAALEAQATLALPVPQRNQSRQRAEQLAAREPEKVAQQLRQWMHGDEG
jgi:flagellar M-ring protein FliF